MSPFLSFSFLPFSLLNMNSGLRILLLPNVGARKRRHPERKGLEQTDERGKDAFSTGEARALFRWAQPGRRAEELLGGQRACLISRGTVEIVAAAGRLWALSFQRFAESTHSKSCSNSHCLQSDKAPTPGWRASCPPNPPGFAKGRNGFLPPQVAGSQETPPEAPRQTDFPC